MPTISYDCASMDKETKAKLIEELTATASRVTGTPARAFTIIIRENGADNIGVGGQVLSERLKNQSSD